MTTPQPFGLTAPPPEMELSYHDMLAACQLSVAPETPAQFGTLFDVHFLAGVETFDIKTKMPRIKTGICVDETKSYFLTSERGQFSSHTDLMSCNARPALLDEMTTLPTSGSIIFKFAFKQPLRLDTTSTSPDSLTAFVDIERPGFKGGVQQPMRGRSFVVTGFPLILIARCVLAEFDRVLDERSKSAPTLSTPIGPQLCAITSSSRETSVVESPLALFVIAEKNVRNGCFYVNTLFLRTELPFLFSERD